MGSAKRTKPKKRTPAKRSRSPPKRRTPQKRGGAKLTPRQKFGSKIGYNKEDRLLSVFNTIKQVADENPRKVFIGEYVPPQKKADDMKAKIDKVIPAADKGRMLRAGEARKYLKYKFNPEKYGIHAFVAYTSSHVVTVAICPDGKAHIWAMPLKPGTKKFKNLHYKPKFPGMP